jgi:hypothetical protein
MKSLRIALALIISAVIGATASCAALSKDVAAAAPITHATEVAAVTGAQNAWVVAANVCVAVANVKNTTPNALGCGEPLSAAHDLIVDAAAAVDTQWNQSAACNLLGALELVQVATKPLDPPVSVATAISDGIELATLVTNGTCTPPVLPVIDAGGDVAVPQADAAAPDAPDAPTLDAIGVSL